MTLLAVTFSIAMRVERLAARNFADGVRAKLLTQTALVRAMETIDKHMLGPPARVYPAWDATYSVGTGDVTNILTATARNLIPGGYLQSEVAKVENRVEWVNVSADPPSRVAYLVLNTSGLLDINSMGGEPEAWRTSVREIDFSGAPEFSSTATRDELVEKHDEFVRYEDGDEMYYLLGNTYMSRKVETFQAYSYDPGPDVLFFTVANPPPEWWKSAATWVPRIEKMRPPPSLGTRDALRFLGPKFNINSITNYNGYINSKTSLSSYLNDASFMANYFKPLTDMLQLALPAAAASRPSDMAWNIVNYLDEDRLPHGETTKPWLHSEGGEAMPMINEIAVEPVAGGFKVHTELWYPFAPIKVTPADGYYVSVMIFTNDPSSATEVNIGSFASPTYSYKKNISTMEFGGPNEFFVSETPVIPLTSFYMLHRIYQTVGGTDFIVDEAMGYERGDTNPGKRKLFRFDGVGYSAGRDYAVNDPRANGQVKYWLTSPFSEKRSNGGDGPWSANSLGAMNTAGKPNSAPYDQNPFILGPETKGQGVPIAAVNGPMKNIGEIGHIWQSNLDDEKADAKEWYWRNFNLMKADEGALLLDMMTTYAQSGPTNGLFCINSRQTNAWTTAFNNLQIGLPNAAGLPLITVTNTARDNVIRLLSRTNCVSFFDLFTTERDSTGGGGQLATAFRRCAPQPPAALANRDVYEEDTFRKFCELVTFRQNTFMIVMAAQALAPDQKTVLSERRAIAQVYRDAYTGRRFVRSFKWLDE
ncbi:MAG: hypothetical protein K8T26_05375 [Lentisphaerae bacterium]|nr:hypothetical protein [Lentisphaerota bacterium]